MMYISASPFKSCINSVFKTQFIKYKGLKRCAHTAAFVFVQQKIEGQGKFVVSEKQNLQICPHIVCFMPVWFSHTHTHTHTHTQKQSLLSVC